MDQPMTMDYMRGWMMDNWLAFSGAGILILVLLVIYYVLLVRAVLDMLRRKANTALLVFAMLGLIPLPPLIILGVLMIIIWTLHERTGANASPAASPARGIGKRTSPSRRRKTRRRA
jgi:hypothetical protein